MIHIPIYKFPTLILFIIKIQWQIRIKKFFDILSIHYFPNFNKDIILTSGEIPAGVRDALLGVQHGEQLEGVRCTWYQVAEHVGNRVRRYHARLGVPRVAETLHP